MAKFVAKGTFPLPNPGTENPTVLGGALTLTGTTGTVSYSLPTSGWRGLGPNGDGSRGFKFRGDPCKVVLVKSTVVKALCRPSTGTLALPEPGPVTYDLRAGGLRYCAQCDGTPHGNPDSLFKRIDCPAPAACP